MSSEDDDFPTFDLPMSAISGNPSLAGASLASSLELSNATFAIFFSRVSFSFGGGSVCADARPVNARSGGGGRDRCRRG